MSDDLITELRHHETEYQELVHGPLCGRAADEIGRLQIGQAVIAKQVGYYKPETPDFEFVRVPLGILRRALRCDPPPYPEEALD